MKKTTPRDYPETMPSADSGRPMVRGEKEVAFRVGGKELHLHPAGLVVLVNRSR